MAVKPEKCKQKNSSVMTLVSDVQGCLSRIANSTVANKLLGTYCTTSNLVMEMNFRALDTYITYIIITYTSDEIKNCDKQV